MMAGIDGQWDSVAQSPMGEQRSVLTLTSKPDGSFAGTNSGPMGSMGDSSTAPSFSSGRRSSG